MDSDAAQTTHPLAAKADKLARRDVSRDSMRWHHFLDAMELTATSSVDGYTARVLYHLYLDTRARIRDRGY